MKPNAGIFSYAADYDTPGLEYVAGQETQIYKPSVPVKIESTVDKNGDKVSVAKDQNGNVVAVKKQDNVLPWLAAAAAFYFLF